MNFLTTTNLTISSDKKKQISIDIKSAKIVKNRDNQ